MGLALAKLDTASPRQSSPDAYGNARHHRLADLTGDGATTSADSDLIRGLGGSFGGYGIGDLNRDGIVDSTDTSLVSGDLGSALPAGQISAGSGGTGGTDNIIGYAGYVFNAEFHGGGLYTVRHRHYSPELGRWITRDPIGYVDGMNLYEYVRSHPINLCDFSGLYASAAQIDCMLKVNACLRDDLHVRQAYVAANRSCEAAGKRRVHISCQPSSMFGNSHGKTKWRWFRVGVRITINNSASDVCNTLVHELTHARQFCDYYDWWNEWYDGRSHAVCSEIEAYAAEPRHLCQDHEKDSRTYWMVICNDVCHNLKDSHWDGDSRKCYTWCMEHGSRCKQGRDPISVSPHRRVEW